MCPVLALVGVAAAAGAIAIDHQLLITKDIKDLLTVSGVLRHGKRFMAESTLVPDIFQTAVDTYPQHSCLAYEDRVLTYQQVDEISNRIAQWALAQGFQPGDKVALLMQNRPEFMICWLGLLKIGVIAALVNTHLLSDGLYHCIHIADPKAVLLGVEMLDKYATVVHTLPGVTSHVYGDGVTPWMPSDKYPFAQSVDTQLSQFSSVFETREFRKNISITDAAMLIYTSGTTGLPKAAKVNHYNIIVRSLGFKVTMNVTSNDRVYCPLPLYHTSGGNLAVAICFQAGAILCLSRKFSVSKYWDEVRRFDATIVQYIGEMCRYLVNAPYHDNDANNHVRAAFGNGLRPDIWNEFQDRFGIPVVSELYGSTEGVMGFANYCATKDDRGHLGRRGVLMQALLGVKIVRYDVETDTLVRDKTSGFYQECALGEVGEMLCKIAESDPARKYSGYYHNEEDSNKKVLRNVFVKGDAYFRSGDLFKIDASRYWHFIDRIGDTFRWKGENVATNEVAEAIAKFEGLSDICVYGVQVPGHEGRACLAAMVFDDKTFDMQAFATHVQARLPSYAVPLFIRQLGEMAVTGTMKYEKAKLRKQGMDPSQVSDKLWYYVQDKHTYERLTTENYHSALTNSRL